MRHLGETSFHHFCQNEGDFEGKHGHIDFPVREPLATTISWRSYQKDRTDMDEFRRWEAAIEYLKDKDVTYHVMERLPNSEGDSGEFWAKDAYKAKDLEALKKLPEVRYLLAWFKRPEIGGFFRKFYTSEELWWQNS